MIASCKYTFLSLKNTKGFLVSMFIMPILMVLLITITLSYSPSAVVGVVSHGNDAPFSLSFARTQRLEPEEIDYFLGSAEGSLVVVLDVNGRAEKYHSAIPNHPLIPRVEKDLANPRGTYVEQPRISYSLGILLFKLMTAASLIGTLLIQERNNGIAVRLKNAGTLIYSYVLGKLLAVFATYTLVNGLLLAFYRAAGFDFGNTNPGDLFALFSLALLVSGGIFVFASGFMKNEGHLWMVSTGVLFPLALFSGVLFPIEGMPAWMQAVARLSPQYFLQKMAVSGQIEWFPVSVLLLTAGLLLFFGIRIHYKKV